LSDFLNTKLGVGEGVPGPHLRATFNHCGFKNMGLSPRKSQKLVIFSINFLQMGISH